jgi:hypothetical protein
MKKENLTFDQHFNIMKLLKDETKPSEYRWVSIVSFMNQIPESEVTLMSLPDFNNARNEIATELNNLVLNAKEIKEFEFNNKSYKVDTVVFNANTALYADYMTLVERYNNTLDLYKHIVSLLIYEDQDGKEIYTTQRYETNLFLVGRLPVEIVYGVASFFLNLVIHLTQLSHLSLEEKMML